MSSNNYSEEHALAYLPSRLSEAVRRSAALYHGTLGEIRLRAERPVFITVGDKNISCPAVCTSEELNECVSALCGNSMYCHSETIKEGYICTSGGIRAGVCGRAVCEGGEIIAVKDISSVNIRIPHRVPGAADELCRLICDKDFSGMIIYSPPGGGKTTALREICARLSSKPYNLRLAVVDTRFEICGALGGDMSFDALEGYPRAAGMETAVRTLSPQLIICDEIGSPQDAAAIRHSFGAGVPTVVSAHASCLEELCMKSYMRELIDSGAFTYAVGMHRRDGKWLMDISRITPDRSAAGVKS